MIVAALSLLAIGTADLLRQFLAGRTRIIAWIAATAVLLVAAAVIDALVWALIGVAVAAVWVAVVPSDGSARAGLWPAGILGVGTAVAMLIAGPRDSTIAIESLWTVPGRMPVPIDLLVLVIGCLVFLLESANIVVRTALRAERIRMRSAAPESGAGHGETSAPATMPTHTPAPVLKGGRLIGPLERVLVFALMLAGAYTLIAAVFAAKGIVRFPEISRDSAEGNRAEYFLIGSLVSWVLALAAAFVVWWAGPLIA